MNYRAKKLESRFGYFVPPYPEDLMNVSGYMSMENGEMKRAKMFFEQGILYYPNSANMYDSMADYYEASEDVKSALEFVKKAYAISGSDYHKNRMEELVQKVK
jgi:tetratricopeptide (TPR) repeat protein